MTCKLSEKTVQEILELYCSDWNISDIAARTKVSYSTAYANIKANEWGFASAQEWRERYMQMQGFESLAGYQIQLAEQKGFISVQDHQTARAKEKGFESLQDYRNHWAQQQGYGSIQEYEKYRAGERQDINKELSTMLRQRLSELGQTQKWLAEQVRATQGAVSRYISGEMKPRKRLQERLCKALKLPYKTIDDLLQEK